MLIIEKNGHYYNASKNKCPFVRILNINRDKTLTCNKETEEQLHKLEDIPLNIKIKDCNKVEDLKEGEELEVRGYVNRSTSLIVNLSGIYYVGTYWLKQIINTKQGTHRFNVITGPLKTTPIKNKCRTFYTGDKTSGTTVEKTTKEEQTEVKEEQTKVDIPIEISTEDALIYGEIEHLSLDNFPYKKEYRYITTGRCFNSTVIDITLDGNVNNSNKAWLRVSLVPDTIKIGSCFRVLACASKEKECALKIFIKDDKHKYDNNVWLKINNSRIGNALWKVVETNKNTPCCYIRKYDGFVMLSLEEAKQEGLIAK